MKPATLILLCFSFLLLSGSTRQYLPVSLQSSSFVSYLLKGERQVQTVPHSKGSFLTSADTGSNGYDYLNAVEPEDSDDEDSRFPECSNGFLQPWWHQLSGNLHRYHKDRLPACLHFALLTSGKYLTYRAIRI